MEDLNIENINISMEIGIYNIVEVTDSLFNVICWKIMRQM